MKKLFYCALVVFCCIISSVNVPYAYAKDIYAISTAGIDCYVSAESIRQTSDKSFYVHIKNVAHPQDNESESIAYFEGEGWAYDDATNTYSVEDMLFFYYDDSLNEWKSRSLGTVLRTIAPKTPKQYAYNMLTIAAITVALVIKKALLFPSLFFDE